jgi:hypothetical protein
MDNRTAYLYFIFCSNIIITIVVYYQNFVSWAHYQETHVSLQPHKFLRSVLNYYLLNDIKFTVFGKHFVVKHLLDNTSACTLFYSNYIYRLYTSFQTLK